MSTIVIYTFESRTHKSFGAIVSKKILSIDFNELFKFKFVYRVELLAICSQTICFPPFTSQILSCFQLLFFFVLEFVSLTLLQKPVFKSNIRIACNKYMNVFDERQRMKIELFFFLFVKVIV